MSDKPVEMPFDEVSITKKYKVALFSQKNALLICVSLLALLLGIDAYDLFKDSQYFTLRKVIPALLSEVGIAGLVAVLLIYTIEKHNKDLELLHHNHWLEKISKEVFKTIYRRYIPENVFHEVENCLLTAPTHRRELDISYEITRMNKEKDSEIDSEEHVICNANVSYYLKNALSHKTIVPVPLRLEKSLDPAWIPYIKVNEVKITRGAKTIHLKTDDDIKGFLRPSDSQVIFEYPLDLDGNEEAYVETSATLIKRKDDLESWIILMPTDGVILTVTTPNADIEVDAKANHSKDFDLKKNGVG